ncbi:MAG: hypothetical protein K8T10_08220 [Candidatus Eremiobacteraeota bacterium]|nr:hypothetical protein [Candidatus Eremiobacteraeota bacterium]
MDNKIGSVGRFPARIAPAKKMEARKESGVKAGEEIEIKDKVQIRGGKEKRSADKTKSAPEITNQVAYNALEVVKSQLYKGMRNVGDSENHMNRSNNEIQDASRDLKRTDYPILKVERDDEHSDVSREGYEIASYLKSADSNLSSGKSQENSAEQNMDSLKRELSSVYYQLYDIKNSLVKPDEQVAVSLVQRAIDLTRQSYDECTKADRSIILAGREIVQGMDKLNQTDKYIRDVKSDKEGKDVSDAGNRLSYLVDRTQWDIRDTEKEIRNSQTGLVRTKQSIGSVIGFVTNAQALLINKKKK